MVVYQTCKTSLSGYSLHASNQYWMAVRLTSGSRSALISTVTGFGLCRFLLKHRLHLRFYRIKEIKALFSREKCTALSGKFESFIMNLNQCCGSESVGSICFWAFRIRILQSSSKNSKKNINYYCFVTSLWLFIFENWCKFGSWTLVLGMCTGKLPVQ